MCLIMAVLRTVLKVCLGEPMLLGLFIGLYKPWGYFGLGCNSEYWHENGAFYSLVYHLEY